ncbi:MAG: shikimate kinase [Chitinophagaceae bacterium]
MKIFLIGFMGSGKSYWGNLLSQKLNLPFFDLDEKIIEKTKISINQLFLEEGEEYFRGLEKETLLALTSDNVSFVMACGGGTPCFYNNMDFMNSKGITVWIHCTTEKLYKRLEKEKEKRPLLSGLNEEALRGYIIKKYGDRKMYYEKAAVVIKEEDISLEKLTDQIFHV